MFVCLFFFLPQRERWCALLGTAQLRIAADAVVERAERNGAFLQVQCQGFVEQDRIGVQAPALTVIVPPVARIHADRRGDRREGVVTERGRLIAGSDGIGVGNRGSAGVEAQSASA